MISNKYTKYAEDVLSGKIVACHNIQLACKRYLDWFDREDIEFRVERCERVVNFISKLKHFDGKAAGKPFVLEQWQKWVIYNIFGWYYKESGLRVTNKALILMARKNGKTAFAAAISLYCLIGDGEQGAQVLNVANNGEQARLLFNFTTNFAKGLDPNKRWFRVLRDRILFEKTHSYARTLSSDSSGLDGLSASIGILDETHEYKDSKLYDVLVSSQGFRENPLILQISTTGFNLYGFLKEYRDMSVEVMEGLKEDDNLFAALYELDDGDDWTDENVWIKANPNLDVTTTKRYLRSQVKDALNNTSLEVGVRTKLMNQWVQSKDTWIPEPILMKASQDFQIEDLIGKADFMNVGIDLAAVSDLTAVSFMIKVQDKFYFKTYCFVPEDTVEKSSNSTLYKEWIRNNYLIVTPGNVTDYDYILNLLKEKERVMPIAKVSYDQWNATQFAINATEAGLPLEPFSQALGNFNGCTKTFERLILSGHVVLDNNPLVRWAFQNVILKWDWNENCKPTKGDGKQNKIDPVISILESLGGMLEDPNYNNEIMTLKF